MKLKSPDNLREYTNDLRNYKAKMFLTATYQNVVIRKHYKLCPWFPNTSTL